MNWGPKTFRFMNCWTEEGRNTFVLKEKLKILKNKLKVWNTEHFGDLDQRLGAAKNAPHNSAIERVNVMT